SVRAISDAARENVVGGLNNTMDQAGLNGQKMAASDVTEDGMNIKMSGLVGKMMNIILGTVGSVFLIIAIYAGFLWMTAGGNEDQVGKAKHLITAAAIGMLLILGAYAITWFVVEKIFGAVNIPVQGQQIEPITTSPSYQTDPNFGDTNYGTS
ncbi:MAG: hypothetical protein V1891_03125, partial [bacterium]